MPDSPVAAGSPGSETRPDTGTGPGGARPLGRRRGRTETRDAIRAAARQAFEEHGYAATSLREVARRAGVDASLIVHFYGSKAGLLTEVVQWPTDLDQAIARITAEGAGQFGRRLAALFIENWENDSGSGTSVLMMFHAAIADPKAAALLREFLRARMIEPCLAYLDADRRPLRASLIAGQVFGFGITHYLLRLDDETISPDQLSEVLGRSLQRLATDPL